MPISVKYPHIDAREGQSPRLTRLPRIRVAQIIMDHLAHGWSAEEICRQYPHLTPAEVHAAFLYFFDNRDAIEREIEEDCRKADELDKQRRPSPLLLRLRSRLRS